MKVLDGVVHCAPCTSTELEAYMTRKYNMSGSWKVLSWLKDTGVVYETGVRACRITGRVIIEWDLTGNMPLIVKKKSKPANINRVIDYILLGMKIRGWDSIDIDTLTSLQTPKHVAKKKKIQMGRKLSGDSKPHKK
jgi:hypothetical protein